MVAERLSAGDKEEIEALVAEKTATKLGIIFEARDRGSMAKLLHTVARNLVLVPKPRIENIRPLLAPLRQKDEESVETFATRVKAIREMINGCIAPNILEEHDLVIIMKNGLEDRLRTVAAGINEPTVDELVSKLSILELLGQTKKQEITPNEHRLGMMASADNSANFRALNERIEQMHLEIQGLWAGTRDQRSPNRQPLFTRSRGGRGGRPGDRSNKTCNNCGKLGHFAADCYSRKEQETGHRRTDNRYCDICKRDGHTTDSCWYNSKERDGTKPFIPRKDERNTHRERSTSRPRDDKFRGGMKRKSYDRSETQEDRRPKKVHFGRDSHKQAMAATIDVDGDESDGSLHADASRMTPKDDSTDTKNR